MNTSRTDRQPPPCLWRPSACQLHCHDCSRSIAPRKSCSRKAVSVRTHRPPHERSLADQARAELEPSARSAAFGAVTAGSPL